MDQSLPRTRSSQSRMTAPQRPGNSRDHLGTSSIIEESVAQRTRHDREEEPKHAVVWFIFITPSTSNVAANFHLPVYNETFAFSPPLHQKDPCLLATATIAHTTLRKRGHQQSGALTRSLLSYCLIRFSQPFSSLQSSLGRYAEWIRSTGRVDYKASNTMFVFHVFFGL